LTDQTGSHDFISELSSLEVRTSGTRRTRVFHVSTLESRTSEVLSESGGKRLSIDDYSSGTTKASRLDVTSEGLTAASEPFAVQTLGETESMDNLVHDADHLLFVQHGIGGYLHVGSTDGDSTYKGSLGSGSQRASNSAGDVAAGGISFYQESKISRDTVLQN